MAASQKRGAKQSAAAQRLRAESQKAAARADTAKRQVRLAKAVLKRARKLAKASKKAAKQARKKAKAQAAGKGGTTRDLLQPPARTSAKRKKPTVDKSAPVPKRRSATPKPKPTAPKRPVARSKPRPKTEAAATGMPERPELAAAQSATGLVDSAVAAP